MIVHSTEGVNKSFALVFTIFGLRGAFSLLRALTSASAFILKNQKERHYYGPPKDSDDNIMTENGG